MKLLRVLRISRPRFWIYELGPYMIGIIAALLMGYWPTSSLERVMIGVFAVYFLIPANIWIYGINDIYDYETDRLNPKKLEGYEALVLPSEQPQLRKWINYTAIPFIVIFLWVQKREVIGAFIGFLFFSGMYSAYPIRAKAKPIIDMMFSAGHYVMTAVFAWSLIAPISEINIRYIIAGLCWCMAMHLYSAVPDIDADRDAGLYTTAMLLGFMPSLIACVIMYGLSAYLTYPVLGWVSAILLVPYLIMMIWTILRPRQISYIYTYFPWINMTVGMVISLLLIYTLIYG